MHTHQIQQVRVGWGSNRLRFHLALHAGSDVLASLAINFRNILDCQSTNLHRHTTHKTDFAHPPNREAKNTRTTAPGVHALGSLDSATILL